jgi:hypothetical protein
MLVLTSRKYEVEEPIKAQDENGNVLYEMTMQLTGKEHNEINEIIFNKESIQKAQKLSKIEDSVEYEKLEKEIEEIALKNQARFEDIVFKEHKEPLKTAVGEYKYLELVEMVFSFFWTAFIEKRTTQINTMTTDLRKIGGN